MSAEFIMVGTSTGKPEDLTNAICKALSILAPPPSLNVAQWAELHREIPRGTSAEPGKWRNARLPYLVEPMESFTDPSVSDTVLLMAKQMGKTEILLNALLYIIDVAPANILLKGPTQDNVKRFSQKKLSPIIAAMPRIKEKIKPHRSRDSGNTILSKLFPGGSISMVGANSAAALRQLSCQVVIQDEIDSDRPNQEGDPVDQADGRAENFHDAIFIKASTPTREPLEDGKGGRIGSRIQILFDDSDQRHWNVPCPHCQHWQILKWSNVKWHFKEGEQDVAKPEAAVYVCEGCRAELTDFERVRMVMQGKWVAKFPHRRRRGYHLSGLYRIMGKKKKAYATYLHEFVAKYLDAQKAGDAQMEFWTNTFLAECWKLKINKLDVDPLLARREKYGPDIPKKVLVLTCQVDVQSDRLEYEIVGWGLGDETWGIEFGRLYGNPFKPEVWRLLDSVLNRQWVHPFLGKLRAVTTVIDSGGQAGDRGFTDPVYRFVRTRQPTEMGPGVYAIKGSSQPGAELVSNRRPKKGICLKIIGTSSAKTTLMARMQITEPGPRYMHFPIGNGYDEEFFAQLGAEAPEYTKRRGYTHIVWHKIRDRNEALDLRVYSLAAKEILNPDLAAIAQKAGRAAGPAPATIAEMQNQMPPRPRPMLRRPPRLARPFFKPSIR